MLKRRINSAIMTLAMLLNCQVHVAPPIPGSSLPFGYVIQVKHRHRTTITWARRAIMAALGRRFPHSGFRMTHARRYRFKFFNHTSKHIRKIGGNTIYPTREAVMINGRHVEHVGVYITRK